MKVGHIYINDASAAERDAFVALVEALDRLAVPQYVLLDNDAAARRLRSLPYVDVGPVVQSPVMATCYMRDVDVVHAHGQRSGQAGLLLALTRSIPFVLTLAERWGRHPLRRSVIKRASRVLRRHDIDAQELLGIYLGTRVPGSELPEDANGR